MDKAEPLPAPAFHRDAALDAIRDALDAYFDEVNPEDTDTDDLAETVLGALERAAAGTTRPEPLPAVGDRYTRRDGTRQTVTVTRVWTTEAGHLAVAYEWRDGKLSFAHSACPLAVFHRHYEPLPS